MWKFFSEMVDHITSLVHHMNLIISSKRKAAKGKNSNRELDIIK